MSNIGELIQILAGTDKNDCAYVSDAEVVSVNENERTCQCQLISSKVKNTITVRLMSALGDGVLIVPKKESTITVLLSRVTEPIAFQYSDVEKIIFLGGDLKGLVKLEALVNKINRLENAFNQHTHAGVQSGGSSTAVPGNIIAPITMEKDLENKNVKHG